MPFLYGDSRPSRSSEANTPPEHRCAFARSPRAIALQMPSPTNRPCSLTVKAHAIAWSIRPPSASFRMPSDGLPFPLGTRIHPVRAARARPFATRVTATRVIALRPARSQRTGRTRQGPRNNSGFFSQEESLPMSSKTKRCAPEFLRRDKRFSRAGFALAPCHWPEPSRPPCHKARHRVSPKT